MKSKEITGPMRIPFLVLAPASVVCGYAAANFRTSDIAVVDLVLLLISAILSHISVNAMNEYHDFRSGLDAVTTRTPFSGGSGALPPESKRGTPALVVSLLSMLVATVIGLVFIVRGVWVLIPIGAVGALLVMFYTPVLVRRPWLCLLAPGLGFGPCMVLGIEAALTGSMSSVGLWLSLPAFFLVNALLLINQFPDVDADRSVGRRTLLVVHGRRNSAIAYAALIAGAYGSIIASVLFQVLPATALIGLAPIPISILVVRAVFRHGDSIPKLVPFLGLNVITVLSVPIAFAVGILIA